MVDNPNLIKMQTPTISEGPSLSEERYSKEATKSIYFKLEEAIIYRFDNLAKEVIKELLKRNIKINAPYLGYTLLTFAAGWGNKEIVRYLVEEQKANVNSKDYFGYAPLFYAIRYEHEEVVKFLIERGANLDNIFNSEYYGYRSVVEWIILSGKFSIFNILLEMYIKGKIRISYFNVINNLLNILEMLNKQSQWVKK